MSQRAVEIDDDLWARHNAQWREPSQITSQWSEAVNTDPILLRFRTSGSWWELLSEKNITLLVTREYEHLVIALSIVGDRPRMSYLRLPHPSGLAVNRETNVVHIASTRNPNQIFDFRPVIGVLPRLDADVTSPDDKPLLPVRSRYFPGCLYLHDLALIRGQLLANAVGQNAVISISDNGLYERRWWPKCIEGENGPVFGQNHLQLNSIAAGSSLTSSYFSASAAKISARRPGHKNFPVDRRGVIFSGRTREPIAFGLSRPHSARLHEGMIWVDNSGYGEIGFVEVGKFKCVARLPGWTRGLCFYDDLAFVGVSRVIPRFRQYAPGLELGKSRCGVYAVSSRSGEIVGNLTWEHGNQVFAVDWVHNSITSGFPFVMGQRRGSIRQKLLFYTFETS